VTTPNAHPPYVPGHALLQGRTAVITAAAGIMIVVFASLIPSDQVFIKVAGVGMVAAILVDAAIIRMLLVPALMHLLGRGNWWLPRGMERHLPHLHIEGPSSTSAAAVRS